MLARIAVAVIASTLGQIVSAEPANAGRRGSANTPGEDTRRPLSNQDLLRYAATRFDPGRKMFTRDIVGVHQSRLVVAIFPCSDVCPTYTKRIIHYDVPLEDCDAAGGVLVPEHVPRGTGTRRTAFCTPAILAVGYQRVRVPPGAACAKTMIPRLAGPRDLVCVTPLSRALALQENKLAPSRTAAAAGGSAWKPCRQGFVWREAHPDDSTCVTPADRHRVKLENNEAGEMRPKVSTGKLEIGRLLWSQLPEASQLPFGPGGPKEHGHG